MQNQFKANPLPEINGEPVLQYYYLAGAPRALNPQGPRPQKSLALSSHIIFFCPMGRL